MLRVIVFLLLTVAAQAQTWTSQHAFDTGWVRANDAACVPVTNEPTEWRTFGVPAPPPGAFMVQSVIAEVSYRNEIVATNVSPHPAYYRTRPTYTFRVGHAAGLFHHDSHLYAAGHGWSDASALGVVAIGAGTGPAERNLEAGQTTVEPFMTIYPTSAVEVAPLSSAWLTQRRGQHLLHMTAQGEYEWQEGYQGSPPLEGGSHGPISYTQNPLVRVRGWVRYATP